MRTRLIVACAALIAGMPLKVAADGTGLALGTADLEARIAALEALVVQLQEKLQHVSVVDDDLNGVSGPHFIIEGANVHVRSGAGSTSEGCSGQDFGCVNRTGLGNLIIGYNEQRQVWIDNAFPNYVPNQTGGAYLNTGELCDADPEFRDNDGLPLCDRREGSHGLIMGRWNNNMGHANFVAGLTNDVGGHFVSVVGGQQNSATANYSVVSGGLANRAHGFASSVSGGSHNITGQAVGLPFGRTASVSGGAYNIAEAENSSVTGGAANLAAAMTSTISGGEYNRTMDFVAEGGQGGFSSAISGGSYNTASGERSSITGGQSRSADIDDCVLGDNLADCPPPPPPLTP